MRPLRAAALPRPPLHAVRLHGPQLELWGPDVGTLLRQFRRPPTPGSREWHALVEALVAPGYMALDVTTSLADALIDRAGLPVNLPGALHLAVLGAELQVQRVPGPIPGGACYADGLLTISTAAGPRDWDPRHEMAEGVLDTMGLPHTHADVQRLALATVVGSDVLEAAIRRHGRERALTELTRRHRHARSWMIQARLWMRDDARGLRTEG